MTSFRYALLGNSRTSAVYCLILGACLVGRLQSTFAAGRPTPAAPPPSIHRTPPGKQVIEISLVSSPNVQLPGQFSPLSVAQVLREHLSSQLLNTNRYVPMDTTIGSSVFALQTEETEPTFSWTTHLLPATQMEIDVQELSFRSGVGANRMFYGFDRMTESWPNNFPARKAGERPSWMGSRYDGYGDKITGSHVGLDLTESFKIDILFAFLQVQWTESVGHLGLRIRLRHPDHIGDSEQFLDFEARGQYLDVTGGYLNWSAGIEVARRNAWMRALNQAQQNLVGWVDTQVRDQRLFAQIDWVNQDRTLLIATGQGANVLPGTRYSMMGAPRTVIEVMASYPTGSRARFVTAAPKLPIRQWVGLRFREILPGEVHLESSEESESESTVASSVQASMADFDTMSPLDSADIPDRSDHFILTQESQVTTASGAQDPSIPAGLFPQESRVTAFFRSLVEIFLLPYRISRSHAYDREPPTSAPKALASPMAGRRNVANASDWHQEMRATGWAHALSLDRSAPLSTLLTASAAWTATYQRPVTIAILDTGVDFWHPSVQNLRSSGLHYDFISGDGRAHDDQGHGTQIASIVSGIAPHARILSLKIFNPWGITSTSAILSAIKHAVTERAEIVLLPWNTELSVDAFETIAHSLEGADTLFVVAGGAREPSRMAAAREDGFVTPWISVGGLGNREQPTNELTRVVDHKVSIAIPASQLPQARPRRQWFISGPEGSSDQASAVFAAAVARRMALGQRNAKSAMRELLRETVSRPALRQWVRDGRVLNVIR